MVCVCIYVCICVCVCVCVLVAQSCLTLCDPIDCSPPGSSVHEILQARILGWVAMPSSRLALLGKPSVGSVQLFSCVLLFATPWTATRQPSLSITNSRSLLKLTSIESVMPSNHLILCRPLLLSSICPSIRVFSNESALRIRWPKYWSFSFIISPSNVYWGLIFLGLTGLISLQSKGLSRVFSNTVQKQYFNTQLSLWSNSHGVKVKVKWSRSVMSNSLGPREL